MWRGSVNGTSRRWVDKRKSLQCGRFSLKFKICWPVRFLPPHTSQSIVNQQPPVHFHLQHTPTSQGWGGCRTSLPRNCPDVGVFLLAPVCGTRAAPNVDSMCHSWLGSMLACRPCVCLKAHDVRYCRSLGGRRGKARVGQQAAGSLPCFFFYFESHTHQQSTGSTFCCAPPTLKEASLLLSQPLPPPRHSVRDRARSRSAAFVSLPRLVEYAYAPSPPANPTDRHGATPVALECHFRE